MPIPLCSSCMCDKENTKSDHRVAYWLIGNAKVISLKNCLHSFIPSVPFPISRSDDKAELKWKMKTPLPWRMSCNKRTRLSWRGQIENKGLVNVSDMKFWNYFIWNRHHACRVEGRPKMVEMVRLWGEPIRLDLFIYEPGAYSYIKYVIYEITRKFHYRNNLAYE